MDSPAVRVLVAEDDADMRAMISAALRADGYTVVEAANGIELLDAIARGLVSGRVEDAFDVVLSDVRMPRIHGVEVITRLKRANWLAPAIIMTASGDVQFRARLDHLGVHLLEKPFDLDDLRAAVEGAVTPTR